MLSKRWALATPATPEQLRRYRGIHPILAQVLINRGFDTATSATQFLITRQTPEDPFIIPDMNRAVARIRTAIALKELIVVYGDFDADGVTSTALLTTALQKFGARVMPYIPHRVDEGYGLNKEALEELASKGAKLIVTVDCGIRSIQEVEDGKALGLDIIVTDHHSLGPELPEAYAVVNCKRVQYDANHPEHLRISMLAGVGVAFKLVQALVMVHRANSSKNAKDPLEVSELLDLVALGTIADMMPLNHLENRLLVRRGLEIMNHSKRPGLQALMEVAGVEPGKVGAESIGFGLAPRINAAGRLADAMIAYDLLTAPNLSEARKYAATLQDLNTQRQEITRSAQETIREQLQDDVATTRLIFAAHEGFLPGIVGLVAGRLTEEYYRPSVVMELGESESRASCRSIPQFDITSALDQCADLLVRHGGHALAAGFTVVNENIDAVHQKLEQLAEMTLMGQELTPTMDIDVEVDVHQLTESLIDELRQLEPCGNGNPAPTLMARNVHVAEKRTVGKDNRHLKLRISRAGQPPLDAIGFGLGDWFHTMPERIDMAFTLEINEWNGRRSVQANLQDIRPTQAD